MALSRIGGLVLALWCLDRGHPWWALGCVLLTFWWVEHDKPKGFNLP